MKNSYWLKLIIDVKDYTVEKVPTPKQRFYNWLHSPKMWLIKLLCGLIILATLTDTLELFIQGLGMTFITISNGIWAIVLSLLWYELQFRHYGEKMKVVYI